jgi:hypothetical protein
MKIPKKINVLGVPYKITLSDTVELDGEDGIYMGATNEARRLIKLATTTDFDEGAKEQTLFHEIAHVVLAESGLARTLTESENEVFAQCFGNAFHQVFKQMV